MIKYTCKCGSTFESYSKTRKFCSPNCNEYRKFLCLKVKGDNNPTRRNEVGLKISQSRKNRFKNGMINPMKNKKRPDLALYNKMFKIYQTGEKNGAWKGGLSFGQYGIEFNNELKKIIRERDNNTCQVCSLTLEDNKKLYNSELDVHHINYDKEDNTENNLITLCRSCHAQTNFNRKKWTKFFINLKLEKFSKKYGRILITIGSRDRPTELYGLLQSLRTQTYQDFDILIYEDASGTPIQNYYFLNYMINRMKIEGHQIMVYRNEVSQGVSKMRQACIDLGLKHYPHCKLINRTDDDSILEYDYLEKLLEVIDAGYDIASGVVPTFPAPVVLNNIENIKPIIGYCELNKNGELIANFDECGVMYNDEVILPSPHFRSCALMKTSIFDKVNYDNRLTKNGFREEQVFSFKAILAGFKIGCHTGAIAWHLNTPSGGERDTMNLGALNQRIFDETVKKMFEDNGDFLKDYYKKLGVKPRKLTNLELSSQFNLVGNKPMPIMEDVIKNGR